MKMRWLACGLFSMLAACTQATAQTNSAVINFTAEVRPGGYSGVAAFDPFTPGTASHALVNGLGGFASQGASDDWLRFNGQIAINDFTGDGTYTISPDNGVGGIYLVSPLLNRIEADSLRTESALTFPGASRADGQPMGNRDDIYLPDFTPNGTATVTISGNQVSLDYILDFESLAASNAAFLRNGNTPTQISQLLAAENAFFSSIGVSDTGTATHITSAEGSPAAFATPLGGYNALQSAISIGNLSNTIVPTTIGLLSHEIANQNITSDGRLSDLSTPTAILTAADLGPFLDGSGSVTFFDLTGGSAFSASVATAVPEPSSTLLAPLAFVAWVTRRRRRSQRI